MFPWPSEIFTNCLNREKRDTGKLKKKKEKTSTLGQESFGLVHISFNIDFD
jgi:hypothetical protein